MAGGAARWATFTGRAILAVPLVLFALFTANAHAASATSVVMLSDPGDWVGAGDPRLFHPGNGAIDVTGSASYLTVQASGGSIGDSFSLTFAAPPGQTLAPGVYERAQRAPFREAGRPGIDISGDGRGCNTIAGRFEVKEIATAAGGAIERLWIVYEQHCEGGVAALFGEVRIAITVPDGPTDPAPSVLRLPGTDIGRAGTTVPVTVVATDATQITTAAIQGPHATDFPLRLDECSGKALVAGGSCQVWLRFAPTEAGDRSAMLRIADASGAIDDVQLSALAYGGSTRVELASDPGDFIGQGQEYSYVPANAAIVARGTRRRVSFSVDAANGSWWSADFAAPTGDILAPGHYPAATRYPFNGSGAGLSVTGQSRGCNTLTGEFTVTDASFEPDGSVRTFGVTFVQ
ncbi:MAG: hypothetical protein M3N47_03755, partial [Chloroflexota bacterium]|nr:hypothetical protein [Chloroflexota bacterium]